MLGLNAFLALLEASGPLAYGPNPGLELIPYFLGLLGWVGLAFTAILLAPLSALLRRIRRGRRPAPAEPKTDPAPEQGGDPAEEHGVEPGPPR